MDNGNNLLINYGLSACPAIREMTLPFPTQIKISDDNELFLMTCDDQAGKKVNILSKNSNLQAYKKLIEEIYEYSNFFLCVRNIRLDKYIACDKTNYGFYYKFKAETYKIGSFVSAIAPETKYSQELADIFREQKKIPVMNNNLRNWLLYDAKTISVTKEEELAGFIVLSKYYNDFFINFIYVRERYRKHGIGTELLKYASNFVYENGCNYLYGMSPYKARRFYKTLNIESSEGWILWKKKL